MGFLCFKDLIKVKLPFVSGNNYELKVKGWSTYCFFVLTRNDLNEKLNNEEKQCCNLRGQER